MKIYLTRHGETDWNKQFIIQGITDNPLNEVGKLQAQSLQQFYTNLNIDIIVSSSLSRASETAYIATGSKPDIIDDRFIERDFGYFEGKDINLFYTTADKSIYPDFENDDSIRTRVMNGLEHYASSEYNTIAIFAHSHVLKAALSSIDSENYNFSSNIKNCAIVELEYKNNKWKINQIH